MVEVYCDESQNESPAIFDRKKGAEHHVLNHFSAAKDAIKNTDGGLLSRCSFQDDEKTIPLQAADFLAYELRTKVQPFCCGVLEVMIGSRTFRNHLR